MTARSRRLPLTAHGEDMMARVERALQLAPLSGSTAFEIAKVIHSNSVSVQRWLNILELEGRAGRIGKTREGIKASWAWGTSATHKVIPPASSEITYLQRDVMPIESERTAAAFAELMTGQRYDDDERSAMPAPRLRILRPATLVPPLGAGPWA